MDPSPSPITEAAGLLTSGALLTRRVGLRPAAAGPEAPIEVLAGFKPGGLSLYIGDAPIFHLDRDGRWQRAFVDGMHYLKGLDGQARTVNRVREGGQMVLRRRTLAAAEVEALDARIALEAARLGDEVAAGRHVLLPPPPPARAIEGAELIASLREVAAWGPDRWAEQRAAFARAYGPGLPFLPPDCPNPVVLRASPGMTAGAMLAHARGVAALLGRRREQCRDVFLGGADWLDRPAVEIEGLLDAVAAVFPLGPPANAGGEPARLVAIHGWLDAVPGTTPAPEACGRLRARHLARVTLRVDSRALPPLGTVRDLIAGLKGGGIGVGLAVFAAGGGDAGLVDLVGGLPLGPGDLVTLIASDPGASPAADADLSLIPALKSRVADALPRPGPRVVAYNPDKQWT